MPGYGGPPFDPRNLIGRFDRALYGDLLGQFGPGGPLNNDYLRNLTGASRSEFSAAGHDFRNDAEVRPQKPYSPKVR